MERIGVLRHGTRRALEKYGYQPDREGMIKILQTYIVEQQAGTRIVSKMLGCTQANVMYWLTCLGIQNPRKRGGANNQYGRKGKPHE